MMKYNYRYFKILE